MLQDHMMNSIFVHVFICYIAVVSSIQTEVSLNGNDWYLSDSTGKVKNIKATVPGIVHLDLLASNVIEDPYYGENDVNYQWIAYSNWIYQTQYQLTEDITDKQVFIKCDGLDTIATLQINGMQIGTADNYFRRWLFNITDAIKSGTNTLSFNIESAANYSTDKKNQYPYEIYVGGNYIPNAYRNFIRKTQSDFGWDWGPAFVPAGIWQNISIVIASKVYISDIVPKVHYNTTDSSYFIEGLICYIPLDQDQYQLTVTIEVPNTPFALPYKQTIYTKSNPGVKQCDRVYTYSIEGNQLDNYLWKPVSSANPKPLLYEATIHVSESFDVVSNTKKIGFRHIIIAQDTPPNNERGLLFYFKQYDSKTSYPIYIKGSNFIPMDAFVTRGNIDVARRLLTSAIEGNQNMIRVWGGGLYQPDWFYDICDELGLLVWQEFMFAVSLYPRDTNFLDNIREEVTDVVRRLGYHPSIVLWSGNNENQDYAINNASLLIDYSVLYDSTIRATLWNEDTTRSYWPSSPSNGAIVDNPDMGLYIQRWGDSQNTSYGDIHRYDYFSLCNDVDTFPRPRFASEFGFQSYPSFYSLSKISAPSDWSNDSPFFTTHRQHHPDGNKQMENMMIKFFNLPNKTDKVEKFKDFIYLSQVVQMICIGSEAEHYRRLLSEENAYTRGTLYWQLNDIWQAQTWSSIEYGGRWKLLHYAMKRIYSEVVVTAYKQHELLNIYVSVDQPQMSVKYSLVIEVLNWQGKQINHQLITGLQSDGFTGKQIALYKMSDILNGESPDNCYLNISIIEDVSNNILSSTYFFPGNLSKANLPMASINVSNVISVNDNVVTFNLQSNVTAVYVMLDSGSLEGYFNDNGFLMEGMVSYQMTFTSWTKFTVEEFNTNINIRSLTDTYM